MPTPARKYALTKVAPGDYILPSNDTRTIWRIAKYVDGPSMGLGWPKDREMWAIWKWREPTNLGSYIDTEDWDRWEFCEGFHDTRASAVASALRTV